MLLKETNSPGGANFSRGANSFHEKLIHTEKGGNCESGRVASSEGAPDPKMFHGNFINGHSSFAVFRHILLAYQQH